MSQEQEHPFRQIYASNEGFDYEHVIEFPKEEGKPTPQMSLTLSMNKDRDQAWLTTRFFSGVGDQADYCWENEIAPEEFQIISGHEEDIGRMQELLNASTQFGPEETITIKGNMATLPDGRVVRWKK